MRFADGSQRTKENNRVFEVQLLDHKVYEKLLVIISQEQEILELYPRLGRSFCNKRIHFATSHGDISSAAHFRATTNRSVIGRFEFLFLLFFFFFIAPRLIPYLSEKQQSIDGYIYIYSSVSNSSLPRPLFAQPSRFFLKLFPECRRCPTVRI